MTQIQEPGKFEGEQSYVPDLWESALSVADQEWDFGFEDDVDFYVGVLIDDEDRKSHPELIGTYAVILRDDNQGFVHCTEFSTKDEYDATCADLDQQQAELFGEETVG